MRFSSVAVAGSGFAAPVGKAAGRRGKLPLVVEHREKELPRFGKLGDPLRGPDVGRTVVGVGEAQQAPEPALDVLTVDAAAGPYAEDLHGPPPLRGHAPPRLDLDVAAVTVRPGRRARREGAHAGDTFEEAAHLQALGRHSGPGDGGRDRPGRRATRRR